MATAKKSSIPKVNGFTRGFNALQILSYLLMILKIFLFSFIMLPNFVFFMQIIAAFLYYPITIATIVCGYLATVNDPTDEVVKEERRCKIEGEPFDSNRYDYQCNYCNTSVSQESKHCRECDRCVMHFDHHCKWINNCVARTNYKLFIMLVLTLILSTTAFTISGVIFLIDYYTQALDIIQDVKTFKAETPEHWKAIILIVYVVMMSVIVSLASKLLVFHVYLIRNKKTTYDYLMELREKNGNSSKGKGGKELKSKSKITPADEPRTPDHEDEDKRAFKSEGDNENPPFSAEQLMQIAKLKKLAMNLEHSKVKSEPIGIEQVFQQHQTSDDFDMTRQLSIKSAASPAHHQMISFESRRDESHSPKAFKFTIPIAPSTQEKRLKELLNNELPPLKHKHRVLKKAIIIETSNEEQTTMSVLQDTTARKKTLLSKNLTKDAGTINSTEEKTGDSSEVRIKVGASLYRENLLAGAGTRATLKKL